MQHRRMIIGFVLATAVFGVVGAAAAGEVALLQMAEPRTRSGRAWRRLGLVTLTTGLLAGAVVGIGVAAVDAVAGAAPSVVLFAFLEAGVIAGFVGIVLGALVGAVLAVDSGSREIRP